MRSDARPVVDVQDGLVGLVRGRWDRRWVDCGGCLFTAKGVVVYKDRTKGRKYVCKCFRLLESDGLYV